MSTKSHLNQDFARHLAICAWAKALESHPSEFLLELLEMQNTERIRRR